MTAFSLALTASGQDFDKDWIFPKPLTQATRFGISPLYGYRFGGEIQDPNTATKYSFKDGPAYGLILDYAPMGYYGRFELLWSRQDTGVDFQGNNLLGKVDITIDVIQMGGETEYGSESLRGYVSAHVGATHFSSDGECRLTFRVSDPAPLIYAMKPRRNSGVRCIRLVLGLFFIRWLIGALL